MAGPASVVQDPYLKRALEKCRRENVVLQERVRELEETVSNLRRTVFLLTTAPAQAWMTSNKRTLSPQVLQSFYEKHASVPEVVVDGCHVPAPSAAVGRDAVNLKNSLAAAAAATAASSPALISASPHPAIGRDDIPSSQDLPVTNYTSLPDVPPLAPTSKHLSSTTPIMSRSSSQLPVMGTASHGGSKGSTHAANGIGAGYLPFAERLDLKAHSGAVYAVRFSPDGTKLVSTSFDRSFVVWPTDNSLSNTGATPLVHIHEAHRGPVVAVEWMHDSSRIVTGAFDSSAAEWDVGTGLALPVARYPTQGIVHAVTVSPSKSNVFFVATSRSTLHLFDCRVPTRLFPNKAFGAISDGCPIVPSSSILAPCHAQDGSTVIAENDVPVYSIYADLDGTRILTGDRGGAIKTWDLRSIGAKQSILNGREGGAMLLDVTYNDPDHRPITHVHSCPPVAGEDHGRLVAVNSYDSFLRVYDRRVSLFGNATVELTPMHSLQGVVNRNWAIKSSFFVGCDYRPPRPIGRRLPKVRERALRLSMADTSDGSPGPTTSQTTKSSRTSNPGGESRRVVDGHAPSLLSRPPSCEFDSDLAEDCQGPCNSSSDDDCQDEHSSRTYRIYHPYKMPIQSSLILASGSADGCILLFDVGGVSGSGGVLQSIKGHRDRVHSVDFHPTEPILASCGADGQVKIWSPPIRH